MYPNNHVKKKPTQTNKTILKQTNPKTNKKSPE